MSMTASPNNPYFRLSLTFNPDLYFGSQEWVDLTLQMVTSRPPRSLELMGLPGMGKSSLLRYLADPRGALIKHRKALQPPFSSDPTRIFPVLIEFRLLPTDAHPFTYLFGRFQEELKSYLERVKGGWSTGSSIISPASEPRTPAAAAAAIEDALTVLNGRGVRTVFLFDDFHLAFGLLSHTETNNLRPWRDSAAFIISTERRLDKVNAKAAGSPFFQSLPIVRFGGLGPAEAARLIGKPAEDAGWPFHHDDIEFAVARADGHPYLLIVAGSTLWEARVTLGLSKSKKLAVSKEYPQLLTGYFKERFTPTFKMYWENIEPAEQLVLKAAAQTDFAPDNPALVPLEELGLVKFDRKRERHVPFSELFSEFISDVAEQPFEKGGSGAKGVETRLHTYLKQNADRVCTFDELSKEIWGEESLDLETELLQQRVQVTISRLRKKLQATGVGKIVSVRKMGYRFVPS
jgi:hypothetical protein